jgi:type IV pilus assembly protein PilV
MTTRRNSMTIFRGAHDSSGMSMIEVLVTIVIITFGLLGLAALQGKAHVAEMESYQRGQALILLQDMVNRIENNMSNVSSYKTTSPRGTGFSDSTNCNPTDVTRADADLCEWSKSIKGSAETQSGASQGAMINGRGCVEEITTGQVYLIAVVWQGNNRTKAPDTTTCGSGSYDSEDTRRAVTAVVRKVDLSAP